MSYCMGERTLTVKMVQSPNSALCDTISYLIDFKQTILEANFPQIQTGVYIQTTYEILYKLPWGSEPWEGQGWVSLLVSKGRYLQDNKLQLSQFSRISRIMELSKNSQTLTKIFMYYDRQWKTFYEVDFSLILDMSEIFQQEGSSHCLIQIGFFLFQICFIRWISDRN